MQSILDAINEWIKEILIGAINGNLSTMFGDVNEKVGTIAAEVGQTPQGWNAGIFSMILHNEACDAHKELHRHKAKEITFSDLTLEEARQLHTFDEYFKGETAFERAGKKITPKLLLEAIRTLPEEKRKAVLLYYFEGMNDTEIAELFDTSRSTIQYRRTSSFELLKKYLEENADEWDEW